LSSTEECRAALSPSTDLPTWVVAAAAQLPVQTHSATFASERTAPHTAFGISVPDPQTNAALDEAVTHAPSCPTSSSFCSRRTPPPPFPSLFSPLQHA